MHMLALPESFFTIIRLFFLFLYISFFIVIYVFCNLITKNKKISMCVTFFLLFLSLAYFGISANIRKAEFKKQKEDSIKEAIRRKNNLQQACKAESKMTVYQQIPAQSGIFIEGNEIHSYENNIPIRFMPQKQKEDMIDQLFLLKQQCKTKRCDEQYTYPISWTVYIWNNNESQIIKMTDAVFIQKVNSYYYYSNSQEWFSKYFAKYLDENGYWNKESHALMNTYGEYIQKHHYFQINGTKKWWREAGLAQVAKDWTHHYIEHMHWENLKDNDVVLNSVPVMQIYAPYRLAIYDISSVEDRQKGIRRGRIALEDIENNTILSEYIGFEVVPYDHYTGSRQSGSLNCFSSYQAWNEYMANNDPYRALMSSDADIVFENFFNHAVNKKQKAKIKKIAVFP